MCLHPAAEGGLNRIVNMVAVLEVMNYKYPDLVSRLYQPYFFDRQREHSETEKKTIFTPLLCDEDGRLTGLVRSVDLLKGIGKSIGFNPEEELPKA